MKAAILIGSLIIFTLAAEFTIWLFMPRFRFESMFHVAAPGAMGNCSSYRPAAYFGYELIPNADKSVNSFGMRDKEYSFKKPAGTFRIVLLGDSITEYGEWSDLVEDRLNASGRFEILNCAVAGWNLCNYRAYLKYKGLSFKPDLVLVGFCLNDMNGYDVSLTILRDNKAGRGSFVYVDQQKYDTKLFPLVDTFLFRHSAIFRIIASRIIFARSEKDAGFRDNSSLAALKEMKTETGGRFLGIIYPYLKPLGEYDEGERKEYSDMKTFLDAAGIEYLDLTPYFNKFGRGIVKLRRDPEDKVHYNFEGNKIKAGIIYDWLTGKLKESRYR